MGVGGSLVETSVEKVASGVGIGGSSVSKGSCSEDRRAGPELRILILLMGVVDANRKAGACVWKFFPDVRLRVLLLLTRRCPPAALLPQSSLPTYPIRPVIGLLHPSQCSVGTVSSLLPGLPCHYLLS